MRMTSWGMRMVAALLPLTFTVGEAVAQHAQGRLVYEMIVTNVGTRSQGWHGVLYGPDGRTLAADPGATIETGVGVFEAHACDLPWTACGFIRAGDAPSAPRNVVLEDPVGYGYRLYVHAEGSRSEGWRGELRHGEAMVPDSAGGAPVETQMGRFVMLGEGAHRWSFSGWIPEDWIAAAPDPK